MKRTRILAVAAGAAAVAAGFAPLAGPARADSGERAAGNTSTSVPEASAAAAERYWTPERMKAARPAALGRSAARSTEASAPEAAPGRAASVAPTAAKGGSASATGSSASAEGGAEHASAVPRPYGNYPDKLNGKVYFTGADGRNYVCSGIVVNSTSKRLVHTAGHCVSDGAGRFHTNWAFVPAFGSKHDGHIPYGTWTARELTVRTEWHSFGNFKEDLGIAIMNDRRGIRIVDKLGGQGVAWNQSRSQKWKDYGYPHAAPFNGNTQWLCVSKRLADDNPSSRPGPLTIRIDCNMTGGSSGGGWLINVERGLGFVNSVNSYRYIGGPLANPDHMYGPYFGDGAKSLYDFADARG